MEPCPESVKPLLDYVEETVGEVVTWLHEKDTFFDILMDEIFGVDTTHDDEDDDGYHGYHTFRGDDGDWDGPQHNSGKTRSGGHLGRGPSAAASATADRRLDASSAGNAQAAQHELGGVTKLAASIYSLPKLKIDEAYGTAPAMPAASPAAATAAAASDGLASSLPGVVSAADLADAYYDALSGLARSSSHFATVTAAKPVPRTTTTTTTTASNLAAASSSSSSSSSAKKATADESLTLHPALTAAATALAFVVGLVATKVMG